MALKLIWRLVNTVSNEVPEVYRMEWIRESPSPDIMYIYREKSRLENWTLWHPIETAIERSGQQALRFDTLNSIWKVVGEPVEAVIWEAKAIESADKNAVINTVKGQVDEDGCTVLSFIDGHDQVGNQIAYWRRYGEIRNGRWSWHSKILERQGRMDIGL
jgi:hypothetical protein